ncbi:MAG: GntR family transcriptional regulator [Ruminococcus sp.]|nr:GntR family transcriptional regulator [Ruminococcus sp.]
MFNLDLSSRTPIYEQLYNNVVRLISSGALKAGDKLPPVRALACDLSVNPNTVSKAYKLLEQDGYIYSNVGKGSFIADNLNSLEAQKQLALEKLGDALSSAVKLGLTREEIQNAVNSALGGTL